MKKSLYADLPDNQIETKCLGCGDKISVGSPAGLCEICLRRRRDEDNNFSDVDEYWEM